ncbi:MAG TPA: hypothetical protein VIZ68_01725 [Thermoplasmata archaeon]
MTVPVRSHRALFGRILLLGATFALLILGSLPSSLPSASAPSSVRPYGPADPDVSGGSLSTYPVTFTEQALPSGAGWNLTLLGHTWNTTAASIVLYEPNGSFAYAAASNAPPGNWSASGSFDVAGGPVGVLVTLSAPNYPVSSGAASPSGVGSPLVGWIVGTLVAVVAVVAVVLGIAGRRRGRDLPPPPAARGSSDPPPPSVPGGKSSGEETPDPLRHML